jgi:membrane associated rhomboid family serine protease
MALPFSIILLPLRTDRTLRAVPYVTYGLCLTILLIYISTLRLSPYEIMLVTQHWGFTLNDPNIVTLFTHAFLHTDIFHVLSNLLLLWIIGTVLESSIGSALFSLVYIASLVAATLLHAAVAQLVFHESQATALIGASGAIFGITGLAAFRHYHIRIHTVPCLYAFGIPIPLGAYWIPLWVYVGVVSLMELTIGITNLSQGVNDHIAHWAHLGGLGLGILAALLVKSVRDARREHLLEHTERSTTTNGVTAGSRQELHRLLAEHPGDPEIQEALAALMMVEGDRERSRHLYTQAITGFLRRGRADRAAIAYLNILRAFPDATFSPREQMTLASALQYTGHHEEAAQAFMLVIEQYRRSSEAETALMRAAALYTQQLGDLEMARKLLQNLLDEYPHSSFAPMARRRLREITPAGS